MSQFETPPDPLRSAFELAYFIHGSRELSLQIALAAMGKLEIAAVAQTKRLYYHPRAQTKGLKEHRFRTKVSLGQMSLLQRLVYLESERHERQSEAAGTSLPPTDDDRIIRFLKHLAQITVKRNAFYVTLGLLRLVYNYSTPDTRSVYDALLNEPDRMKDDSYFRSRKAVLMGELKERFGGLLRILRGTRGEERFEPRPSSREAEPLVQDCLRAFTPWGTRCSADGDSANDRVILHGSGADENVAEMSRMHAVFHPECLRRLTRGLQLETPELRLEIPLFFSLHQTSSRPRPPEDRTKPPELTQDERAFVAKLLSEDAARRRTTSAGLLRVLVDGVERATLDPEASSRVRLEVDARAELVEVRAVGDESIFLAVLLLSQVDAADKPRPVRSAIELEGGQKLSFAVSSRSGSGDTGFDVEVEYRETEPIRSALLFLRRTRLKLEPVARYFQSSHLRPVLAIALLAAIAVGAALYLKSRARVPSETRVVSKIERTHPATQSLPTHAPVAAVSPRSLVPTPSRRLSPPASVPSPPLEQPSEERVARHTRPPRNLEPESEESEATRGLQRQAAASLSDVEMLSIRVLGDDPLKASFLESLTREAKREAELTVTEKLEDADAVLRIQVTGNEKHEVTVLAQLINANGKVLWPKPPARTLRYSGNPEEVARRIVEELAERVRATKSAK